MPVEAVRPMNNLGSANTDPNPSAGVWADCPWDSIKNGFTAGYYFEDNFTSFFKTPPTTEGNYGANSAYAAFTSTNGTMTAGTGVGGELILGSSSASDNDAMALRTLATPFRISRSYGDLWFEARIKTSTIADTKHEIFVGLMQDVAMTAVIPITTTAATLADYNMVGFYRTESNGDGLNTTYKADGVTAVTVGSDEAGTLVADTYVKLGMRFKLDTSFRVQDPNLTNNRKYLLTFFVNGLPLATRKQIPSAAGTDFPNDVSLGLALAIRFATATTPGNTTIDWWRAAQLAA